MVSRTELPDLPPSPDPQRFQILALSGGGYRGLYSARVLERLELERGRPIFECFDLLAGTSIGGIIAIGLALEKTAREIRKAIETRGPAIFPGREGWTGWPGRSARRLRSLINPKYGTKGLRAAVEAIVSAEVTIGDLKRALLVPTVAITAGAPQLFRSVHHSDHEQFRPFALVDIALATAAAPIYFPTARVGPAEYIDGGVIANAPDLAALLEAEHYLGKPREHIFLMSVGTTSAEAAFASRGKLKRGLASWMRRNRLLDITMAAQQEHALELCEAALGPRFFRINATQSADQADVLALDSATKTATRTLEAMASRSASQALRDSRIPQFLHHAGRPLNSADEAPSA